MDHRAAVLILLDILFHTHGDGSSIVLNVYYVLWCISFICLDVCQYVYQESFVYQIVSRQTTQPTMMILHGT